MLGRWSVQSAGDQALGVLGHGVGAKTSGSANSHGGLTSILHGLVVVVGSIGGGGSASDSLGCTDDLTRLGNVVSDWVGRWDAVVVALGRGARSCQEQSDDDGGNKLAVHHDDVAVRVVVVVVVVRGCCCGSFSVSVVLCYTVGWSFRCVRVWVASTARSFGMRIGPRRGEHNARNRSPGRLVTQES